MNNKIFVIVGLLLLFSSSARAGGDYWRVKVQDQIAASEPVVLKLLILEKPRGIIAGCSMITIQVEYQKVPSWSWLPFVHTSHPTQEETTKAIGFLNNKFKESIQTFFGYIGGGLFSEEPNGCTFKSKGLRLERTDNDDDDVVLSFFDLV